MTSEIEIKNAINLLIHEGYFMEQKMTQREEHLYMEPLKSTNKLQTFYKEKLVGKTLKPAPTSIVVQTEKITLTEFKEKAEIPWQIKSTNFNYNVGQVSKEGEKAFNQIVPKVDMAKLIEATKVFYSNPKNARPTLTKYFVEGLWSDVYNAYNKQQTSVAKPDYTGERKI